MSMQRLAHSLAGYLLLLCVVATAATAQVNSAAATNNGDSKLQPGEQNTVNIVQKYKSSVVAIRVTVHGKQVNPMQNLPPEMRHFLKQFGQGQLPSHKETERAAGSGFVVDQKGQILTNYHVVAAALHGMSTKLADGASVTIKFPGKNSGPAKVVGVDQSHDLALLQLKNPDQLPSDAKPIPLADSDNIKVGETAIAIGNPFLLQSTVTQGIVSAVNRKQAAAVSGIPIEYIQTDAAINPGNSGGPLLNSQGQVIGINDEILAPHGTFIGVGFAIPSNLVKQNLSALKAGKFIKKAMMGVAIIPLDKYPKDARQQLNLPDHGAMVAKVKPGSPADKAGLQGAQYTMNVAGHKLPVGGDIIIKANGHTIDNAQTLQKIVLSKSAGAHIKLVILHHGKKKTVTVTLAVLKSNPQQSQ
ncbi:S1C family serine protease [Salinisphaera sp. LB1]|uniref:S1C family serine protease n=1 Tax=Salinisphaera sp. LB1 TaxID=2183911 RepID=UPI0018F31F2B|nr:trypsin-like peptidase domain-containing protein [Salinisphaera sp. LB1]